MSWLDALGWAGSALLIYSLLQARVLRFRTLNLVASGVLVVFNALLGIWPMVAMNAVLAGINVWFIRKLMRERHDERAYQVLEVGASDAYLQHVLSVHGDDIRRFLPGSRAPRRTPAGRRSWCSTATRRSASCSCATRATGLLRSSSTT